MTYTLGDALRAKMKEIREVFIPAYQEIGPTGGVAVAMMKAALTRAERAMVEDDVFAMLASREELSEFKLRTNLLD